MELTPTVCSMKFMNNHSSCRLTLPDMMLYFGLDIQKEACVPPYYADWYDVNIKVSVNTSGG